MIISSSIRTFKGVPENNNSSRMLWFRIKYVFNICRQKYSEYTNSKGNNRASLEALILKITYQFSRK